MALIVKTEHHFSLWCEQWHKKYRISRCNISSTRDSVSSGKEIEEETLSRVFDISYQSKKKTKKNKKKTKE